MYCMLMSIQRISHSVYKVELKTEEKALTKKETGIIHRLSAFKISAQLIIHRFKNFTDVKKFWSVQSVNQPFNQLASHLINQTLTTHSINHLFLTITL